MSKHGELINPYALGGFFLQFCVKNGWLTKEGNGKYAKWYLTEQGKIELTKFNVEISKIITK